MRGETVGLGEVTKAAAGIAGGLAWEIFGDAFGVAEERIRHLLLFPLIFGPHRPRIMHHDAPRMQTVMSKCIMSVHRSSRLKIEPRPRKRMSAQWYIDDSLDGVFESTNFIVVDLRCDLM